MKNLFAVAVLVSCLVGFGDAYECYTCTMATQDGHCLKTTNCSSPTPFCGTSIVNFGFMKVVNKFCSALCVSSTQNISSLSGAVGCCASDLCNTEKIGDNFDFGNGAGGTTGSVLLTLTITGLLSFVLALGI